MIPFVSRLRRRRRFVVLPFSLLAAPRRESDDKQRTNAAATATAEANEINSGMCAQWEQKQIHKS